VVTRRRRTALLATDPWARERLELREMLAPDQNHYDRLETTHRGVKKGDVSELNAARKKIAARAHPDWFVNADQELQMLAHDVTSAANVAYETLTDPARHRMYRAGLLKTHRECGACRGEGEVLRKKGYTGGTWALCDTCEGSGLVKK